MSEDREASAQETEQVLSDLSIFDYDCTEVFDKEIRPLLDQINKICEEHKIPGCYIFQGTMKNGYSEIAGASHGFKPTRSINPDVEIIMALIYKLQNEGTLGDRIKEMIVPVFSTAIKNKKRKS